MNSSNNMTPRHMTPDYDLLVQQVKALGEEENYWLPVLANTSALLMNALPDLNWAGFYLVPVYAGLQPCTTRCSGWMTCISSPGILPAIAQAMRKS